MPRTGAVAWGSVGLVAIIALTMALIHVAWRRPMRLAAGTSDTMTVITTRPLWLNVNVVNLVGHVLPQRGIRFAFAGGDSLPLTTDGQVTCARRSDANVSVVGGSVSALLTVLCRPIVGVAFTPGVRLFVRGARGELPVVPLSTDRQPVRLRSPRVQLGSDSIARLDGLSIEPRKAGLTWADVTMGDCVQTIEIAVDDSVATTDALTRPYTAYETYLTGPRPTEWRIGAGRYELWLRADSGMTQAYRVDVGNTRCVRVRGTGQRMECVLADTATIAVRRLPEAGTSASSMSIRRLADSTVARAIAVARIARRYRSHSFDCEELDYR